MVIIISVYDKNYKRIGFLSNESERGISFEKDVLATTIDSGVYTLSMTIPKITPAAAILEEGNYIEIYTMQGKQLLMMIVRSVEDRGQRQIFCEDGNIQALNNYASAIETPTSPQEIDYYINHTLEGTGYSLKTNQSTEPKLLEFTSDQRILERLREIAKEFELELDFDVEFTPGQIPLRYVNFYQKRVEGVEGFRISSDSLVYGMERERNIYNIATRVEARGRQKETDSSVSTGTPGTKPPVGEESNWSPEIIDRRSSAMGGQATNRSRSAITHIAWHYTAVARANNRTIESHENYWRTTHGWDRGGYHYYINSQGVLYWNYNYERITWGVASNNDYTVHVCVEGNSATDFSAAQLKTRDWITRKIMSELKISPNNVMQHREFPGNSGETCSGYTTAQMNQFRQDLGGAPIYNDEVESDTDEIAEKVIAEAFRIQKLKLPYTWGGNSPTRGMDCSGFVQQCYKAAGLNPSSANWPRATTYSMWAQDGKFRRITKDKLKPGDLIMYDTGYTTPGDVNHVGIYLGPTLNAPNSVIHSGNPNGITQRANSMTIIGYVTVLR